ncbi:MAG: molybdopterin-dependent oxidoreductase, partial [Candidatus Rokuibacteriota bacterium]
MTTQSTRRDILKGGLAAAGLGLFGIPEWALPALAQGETLVPFTDLPDNINWVPAPDRRLFDVRTIDGMFTPRDKWFTTQHYGHPDVDMTTYRLKVTGLVQRELSLTMDELKKMRSTDLVFGFECSGNRRPVQGLSSNGRWTGVPLREVLNRAGVKDEAREFVFFGADHGEEDVEFRGNTFKVDQQFGRSLPREKALAGEPLLVYALNGEPLTKHQGFPLRLLVPGYYGVCNVKFLSGIHAQHDPFVGKWQARWYRTLRGEMINGELKWTESAISRMRLKSFVARVTKTGGMHRVLGVVLHDGTPIKSVEVRVDDGPWQPAAIDVPTGMQ